MFDFEDDVAAFAAVAAIGSSLRHEFLTVKVHHAIPALAGFHVDRYLVCEHAYIISEATLWVSEAF